MTSKEEKNGRKGSTGCTSSSSSQVTTSCCSAVTIRKNYSHSSRSSHNCVSSSVIKKNKMTNQTPPLTTSQNHEKRTRRRRSMEGSTRLRRRDLGVSEHDLLDKLRSGNARRENSNFKITKQLRSSLNTTCKDGSLAQTLSSPEVDSENNVRPRKVAENVMSRSLLDVVESLCGNCDTKPDRRTVQHIQQRRISLSSARKIDLSEFFILSKVWGRVKKFLAHRTPMMQPFKCEQNQLLQIHSKFNHLGPIRLSLVHRRCYDSKTKLYKESVSSDMLWYAYLAISVKGSRTSVVRSERCVSCGRSSVLSVVLLHKCSDCGEALCRLCFSNSVTCYHCTQVRTLAWTSCSWLLDHLRRKFRLMEGTSVHGERRVDGLIGLVRSHCETVMSGMMRRDLDMVDIGLREDWVSQAIYRRYQPLLADRLASFTMVLANMLSDSSTDKENISNIHMELRHLITIITENVIDAKFRKVLISIFEPSDRVVNLETNIGITTSSSDLEFHENIDIPDKTYEDILAVALINLILSKYNEDLEVEDHEIFESKNSPSNGKRKRNSFSKTKHSKEVQGLKVAGANGHRQTNTRSQSNLKYNNYQLEHQYSDLSSMTSTSSSSTATDSLSSSSVYSYSIGSSSSSSYESLSLFRDASYDGILELYLRERREEGFHDNWILKPRLIHSNPYFGLHNLSVKHSLKNYLTNLTDNLKEEIEERKNHPEAGTNDETDCEYTEKHFNSVIKWTGYPDNVHDDTHAMYLYLGEEIGETSTDDVEDNLLPVYETVQFFESLTTENCLLLSEEFSKEILSQSCYDCEKSELEKSDKDFQVVFPSVKALAQKFQARQNF